MTALITFAERFAGRWSSDPSVIARFSKQLPDGHIDQGAIILEHTRLLRALVRQELRDASASRATAATTTGQSSEAAPA